MKKFNKLLIVNVILLIAISELTVLGQPPTDSVLLDKYRQAEALFNEASLLKESMITDSLRQALKKFISAQTLYREVGSKYDEAVCFHILGNISELLSDKQKALEFYFQALPLFRDVNNKRGEAATINNIAEIYSFLGEKQKAIDYFNQSLLIIRSIKDTGGEAVILNNIGTVYLALGENQKAIEYFLQAVSVIRAIGDKTTEAKILSNIAKIFSNLEDEKQEALEYYNQAILIFRATGNKRSEANTLLSIGGIHQNLGEHQKVLEYYGQALSISRNIGDKNAEAAALFNFGSFYRQLGENQISLEYYNQAILIFRNIGNKEAEGNTLTGIGLIFSDLGENQKALDYFAQAILLFQVIGYKKGEARILNNIGAVYSELGEYQKAFEYYAKSLPLFRDIWNKDGEATTLNNIGAVFSKSGNREKALEYYDQSLLIFRAVGNKHSEAYTLTNIGAVYRDLNKKEKAIEYYNQALELRKTVGDRSGEAITLSNIAAVYQDFGDNQKAVQYFIQTLPLFRFAGKVSDEANSLSNIAYNWHLLKKIQFAIFYDKQAINNYQKLRINVQSLDKNIQQTFLKSKEHNYRFLTNSLIAQNRLAEAQQVLNAFKDQQFFDFGINKQFTPLYVTPREDDLIKVFNVKVENVAVSIRALDDFKRSIRNRQPTGDEKIQIKLLEDRQAIANNEYLAFLKKAEIEFSKPADEKDKVGEIPDLRDMQAILRELSANTKQKAAAVYQLVGEENFYLLVITADDIKAVSTPVKNSVVNQRALDFWALLQSPAYDPNLVGKELYEVVFKSLENVLPKDTKTILWSLDGNLRYVPMAALFDGKQYLVERYNHVYFTRADQERMTRTVKPVWTATGLGTSEAKTVELLGSQISFKALPGVGEELKMLFKQKDGSGIFSGETLTDPEFTKQKMLGALRAKRPLVHIASHFSFRAGDETRSFLLLGDGTAFTLADMKRENNLFEGVELLTLSACNTAAQQPGANGREVDGFAELAQRLGANSVMATLWSVADSSTPWLMREFYDLKLNKNQNKAEALRRAQSALLNGKPEIKPLITRTDLSPIKIVIVEKAKDRKPQTEAIRSGVYFLDKKNAPLWDKSKHPPFAHPFYWSPFILFGNWK